MNKVLGSKIFKYEQNLIRLEKFCEAHKCLYIYGAGKFGARCYNFLRRKYKVSGFVVSDKTNFNIYLGLPVISAASLFDCTDRIGVIPAFTGATADSLITKFQSCNVDIFDIFADDFISYCSLREPFNNIHEWLKKYDSPSPLPLPSPDAKINILITNLDAIGDVICATPLIREVRKNYPNAFITVVICERNKTLLENSPYLDELLLYSPEGSELDFTDDNYNFDAYKKRAESFINESFTRKYDIAFLSREILAGFTSIQELTLLFGSGATWRIGHLVGNSIIKQIFASLVQDVFSLFSLQNFAMHEAVYMLDMLRQCGLKVYDYRPELWPAESNRKKALKLLGNCHFKNYKYLVSVGLQGSKSKKNWSEDNYNSLFKSVFNRYRQKILFILVGGKESQEEAARLAKECQNVLDCTGICSLNDTVALMSMCHLYLGSNTGLLHMASVVGINTIVLYGDALSNESYIGGCGPCRWEALGVVNYNLIPPSGLDGCHHHCSKHEPHCINQIEVPQVEMALNCMVSIIQQHV